MSFSGLVDACAPVFELFKVVFDAFPVQFKLLAVAGFGTFLGIYILKWITG